MGLMNRRGWALALFIGVSAAACDYISFSRWASPDEVRLQEELRGYYGELKGVFAMGNSQALAGLFDASITRPMTQEQILAWGQNFFSENRTAVFRIDKFEVEELGYQRAVVMLTYRVETPGGKGDFGGTERDTLVKRRGRWYVSAWEKVSK